MSGESDNLPSGGNETARPLTLDDAAEIDILEPETENEEGEIEAEGEAETDETGEGQEAEESTSDDPEAETEGETDQESAPNDGPADDVLVVVNGEQKTLAELKTGYFRQADYSRKTLELSEQRKGLEAMSARVEQSVNAIAEFLVKQIPAEPDPQLVMTDPALFVQQKALHEQAIAQVNALLSQAGEVKTVANTLTAEQRKELLASENAKLVETFPQTATNEGRQKFFTAAAKAAKELGYSDDDIAKVVDHRTFALAYYADIGMRAEKAREKAKQKVTNVPPVAPQRARPQGGSQAAASRNKDAVKRLASTGSIEDAVAAWSGN